MAVIISIRSHPNWGEQRTAGASGGDASIVIFPGIRYERPGDGAVSGGEPKGPATSKPTIRGRRKTGG